MPEDDTPGPEPEKSADSPEIIQPSIDSLPETLGFVETPEMAELRGQLIEAMSADNEAVMDLAARYHFLGEEVVNRYQGQDFAKAQIGLIVKMGLIRRDSGRIEHYVEDLGHAMSYAWNEGLDDIADTLEAAAVAQLQVDSSEIADESGPTSEQIAQACGEVLTPEDCEDLGAMPSDEALGYAFTLLIENEIDDPEDFLRGKGILQ